jgi:hypothetical protein
MSAATSDRNVGVAADPEVGPAITWFAACVVLATVSVPAPVTGELLTANSAGIASPTLVAVPPLFPCVSGPNNCIA